MSELSDVAINDTPADAWSAQQSDMDRLLDEMQSAAAKAMDRCGELLRALDGDDGSRQGRAVLGDVSPDLFRSIYGRLPKKGWARRLFGA